MLTYRFHILMAVAAAKSYSVAATRLSVSQPTVSYQIKQLEDEYGIEIFQSKKNPLVLTPEGERLLEYANRFVVLESQARRSLEDVRRGLKRFSLGITNMLSRSEVERLILNMYGIMDNLRLNVQHTDKETLISLMSSGELDIVLIEGDMDAGNYSIHPWSSDRFCIAAAPEHPLARYREISFDELESMGLITYSKNLSLRQQFTKNGADFVALRDNMDVCLRVDDMDIIKNMLPSCRSIAFIPYSQCAEELENGTLVELTPRNFDTHYGLNLVYPLDSQNQDVESLIKIFPTR